MRSSVGCAKHARGSHDAAYISTHKVVMHETPSKRDRNKKDLPLNLKSNNVSRLSASTESGTYTTYLW